MVWLPAGPFGAHEDGGRGAGAAPAPVAPGPAGTAAASAASAMVVVVAGPAVTVCTPAATERPTATGAARVSGQRGGGTGARTGRAAPGGELVRKMIPPSAGAVMVSWSPEPSRLETVPRTWPAVT